MKYDGLGSNHHVAYPCDEYDVDGNPVRTWDVFRSGNCVAAGFATRREARGEARRLDAKEQKDSGCDECLRTLYTDHQKGLA